jgi:hypothetical protein
MSETLLNKLLHSVETLPEVLAQVSPGELFGLHAESCQNPEFTQKLVIKQILDHNQNTEYGKKFQFDDIAGPDDFQRKVPVTEWADYENYTERMALGETGILFPGKPEIFIATTGTTGNKSKLIPESSLGSKARNAVSQLRLIAMNRHFPGILNRGCLLPLLNNPPAMKTEGGIPIGYASGLALNLIMSSGAAFRVAFPMGIMAVQNPAVKDYLLMRFSIQQRDLVIILGNNAGRLRELIKLADKNAETLIADIENGRADGAGELGPSILYSLESFLKPDPARAEELRLIKKQTGMLMPKDYWPHLELLGFWLSASVGHYIKDIRLMIPESAKYRDVGYGASEGKFNLPFEPGNPEGALSLLTAFYEFIPQGGGSPLMAHQLTAGQSYEIIVTTWSGLYRYNLRDMVKVTGFTGKNPNIVFLYKSAEILNIAEEKTPAAVVNDVIRELAGTMGIDPVQVQIYPDEVERRYYCYVEPSSETSGFDTKTLAELTHQFLKDNVLIYNLIVVQQKLMYPPLIVEMKTGWQAHLYKMKTGAGQSSAQVKLPLMISKRADPEWVY